MALVEGRLLQLNKQKSPGGLFKGGGLGRLLRGVADDFAVGQCLLQFSNLCLGEVGGFIEIQHLQLRELLQTFHGGQLIVIEF